MRIISFSFKVAPAVISLLLLLACSLVLTAGDVLAQPDIYVSNGNSNGVLRFNGSTGAFISDFVAAGSGGLNGPGGIVFGNDGNLYISSMWNNKVVRYNGTTGASLGDFVPGGSAGLNHPFSLIFGPDGHLYVASTGNHKIIRYNGSTGAWMDDFVTAGLGGLSEPRGLTFGPDGDLYVASALNHKVIRYDGKTGALVGDFVPSGSGGLNGPHGLAFGNDGDLYVSSMWNNKIVRYDGKTGALVGDFVPAGSVGGGLSGPTDLVFGPFYYLYVLSSGNTKVARYLYTGAYFNDLVTSGAGGMNGALYFTFGPAAIGITITGNGVVDCTPNPVPEGKDSVCWIAPAAAGYHTESLGVGYATAGTTSPVAPAWSYIFRNVKSDMLIDATFTANTIRLYANSLLKSTATTLDNALTQTAANDTYDLIKVESGAYFSLAGHTCDAMGRNLPTLSGGWAGANTRDTAPTLLAPLFTIAGSCRLVLDGIAIQ